MIKVFGVDQLMDQDIATGFGSGKQQTDIQRQITAGRATAPARALIAKPDATMAKTMLFGQLQHHGWQMMPRHVQQPGTKPGRNSFVQAAILFFGQPEGERLCSGMKSQR